MPFCSRSFEACDQQQAGLSTEISAEKAGGRPSCDGFTTTMGCRMKPSERSVYHVGNNTVQAEFLWRVCLCVCVCVSLKFAKKNETRKRLNGE